MTDVRSHCDLSDEEFEARRQELRTGLAPLARGREALSDGLALFFDATPQMREQLDDFVAFERECCSGLEFAVHDAPDALRLEIHGIDPAASVFEGVGETGQPAVSERPAWTRLLRSAGLGAVGAFVLFCVVPIALAATLGATFLSRLDDPWVIGAGTLVFAGLIWRWERRRTPRQPAH